MGTHPADAQDPDDDPDTGGRLTIGDLARRTDLSPATLRMWEARHGFPVARRLASGHRRYAEDDVTAVREVVRHKTAGLRLDQAIARVRADGEPVTPSVFAQLRRKHPHLQTHRLHKRTLVAVSRAFEDEFCARAGRGVVWGGFQDERFYRPARARWQELARVADRVTVLADFPSPDGEASPAEVDLPADAPLRREWVLVVDSDAVAVALAAWELPGQNGVVDPERVFETIWTVDPAAVREAGRVCGWVASAAGFALPAPENPVTGLIDQSAVNALFNRVVAYVDRAHG